MNDEPVGAPDHFEVSEHLYRLFLEQVRDHAIFVSDERGRPISWNEGVRRVLGYEEKEFLGLDPAELFSPEDVKAGVHQQELLEATRSGRAGNDRWMKRKDGTLFWASGATTALRDDRGRLIGFGKVLRDLTEQKRYEERLERTVRDLERSQAELYEKNQELELLTQSVVGRELRMIEIERELEQLRQKLHEPPPSGN